MKCLKYFFVICFVGLTYLGCEPNNRSSSENEPAKETPIVFSGDYLKLTKVTYGSGGGFTGAWSGVEISKGGVVTFLENVAGNDQQQQVSLTAADVMPVFVEIQKIGFLKIEHSHPGNMTTTLAVEGEEIRHAIQYEDSAPKAVNSVVEAIETVIKKARKA